MTVVWYTLWSIVVTALLGKPPYSVQAMSTAVVLFPNQQAILTALYRNTALYRDTTLLGDPYCTTINILL